METEGLTQRRIGENQSRFREANESIEATAERVGFIGQIPFLCECADEGCAEILRLDLAAYEKVRQNPRRFFNAPGHEAVSVGNGAAVVAERMPGYVLVDKIDGAGVIAEQEFEKLDRSVGDE